MADNALRPPRGDGVRAPDFGQVSRRSTPLRSETRIETMYGDKAALIAAHQRGDRIKYLFFWGHRPNTRRAADAFGAEIFSQWHPSGFSRDGVDYPTAEHWMMAEKARLFGDDEARERVLRAASPGAAKAIGRAVRGFDQSIWERERFGVVVAGSIHKFAEPPLRRRLLDTGDRVLVEAAPRDLVWGIGLTKDDPRAERPERWPGLNLLGFALMAARAALRADAA